MGNRYIYKIGFIIILLNMLLFLFLLYEIIFAGMNLHSMVHIFIMVIQLLLFFITMHYFKKELASVNEEKGDILNKYQEAEEISLLVLNNSPSGIIVLDNEGRIQYVNPSVGRILGSTETVGLNVLEFDTVRQSRLYGAIIQALNGNSAEILGENYVSYTSREKKTLNMYIYPITKRYTEDVEQVILIIHDVTREFHHKVEAEVAYVTAIEALAEAVDKRDNYTGRHSKNVSEYSSLICKELQLSEEQSKQIGVAASVHDIGKIGIDDSILKKPGKLTEQEYDKMKEHPNIGADIINKIHGYEDISKIIRHHHERWDGKGYPSGLREDEIPLGAQIIAVADTYDAITSNRVYRSSLGTERAIQILLEEKGKQFNPILVDAFLKGIGNIK